MARDLDRRKPLPENHVLEVHEHHAEDPNKDYYLSVFRDGAEIFIGFIDGDSRILNWLHIDADQCEALGHALLKAAPDLRSNAAAT